MNPHGTCATCAWHSMREHTDKDGDTYRTWECWIDAGSPACRMVTASERKPPACERHLTCRGH